MQRTNRRRGRVYPHPPGPVRTLQVPPWDIPLECRLLANTARFHLIPCKVSQNGIVSPVFVEKACHSPYIQNGLRKSPLGILRIPIRLAFSHKELMGLFYPYPGLYCQNDEVSPKCTPMYPRERVVRYPHGSRSELLLGPAPHLTQRATCPRYSQRTRFYPFCRRL